MKQGWIRRRWWEFSQGHSTYLIFLLTFMNFVLIAYRLLIERIPFIQELFPQLWIFVLIFLVSYIPASTIIGTLAFSNIILILFGFNIPCPEPIGAPSGMTAAAPASSNFFA